MKRLRWQDYSTAEDWKLLYDMIEFVKLRCLARAKLARKKQPRK